MIKTIKNANICFCTVIILFGFIKNLYSIELTKEFDSAVGTGGVFELYNIKNNDDKASFDIHSFSGFFGGEFCYNNYGIKVFAYPGLHLESMVDYKVFFVKSNIGYCANSVYWIPNANTDEQKLTKKKYNEKQVKNSIMKHFETEVGAVLSFDYNQNPNFDFKYLDYFSMLYTSHSKQSLGIVFSAKYYYDSLSCSDGLIPETERDNYSVVGGLQSVDSHSVRINAMPMAQIYWVSLGIGLGMTSQIGYFDIGSKQIHKTNSGFGVNSIFFKIAPSSDSLYLSLILNYEGNAAYKLERDVTLGKSSYFVEAKVGYRF